ncbi:probable nitrilase, putitive [Lecanosticta acicola]|uniref:Probable nitrilase, putitive n=1 Tax=Lecanosticta acicola TaxID=111012 RepID=A0AAI8Z4M2_9PEZI|nr:probable nitrilase, putitive [Lecanosticta acicola]
MALAAVGQITSTSSMSHNLSQCRIVIQKAVATGAKAVFLPEASDYIGGSLEESVSLCKPASQSPFVLGLQEDAKKHSLPISVGIHEPSDDPASKRIKNTLVWINEKGEIAQRYQKLHLFDLEIPNGPIMRESKTTEPGREILRPFETAVGKLGSMICFDLRFPEIALALKRQGADILLYPSAFTVPTGKAHWLSLLRARAIECETYVIAAAQVGNHNEKRVSYGHSIVIDPWGEVVAELGGEKKEEPEVILAEIDFGKLERIRTQMPLLRRTDVYPEI